MASRWVLALGMNGELLATQGDAPGEWIGRHPEEWKSAPAQLRSAAHDLAVGLGHAGGSMKTTTIEIADLDATVQLVCIEAIAVHRAKTDVRALLSYSMAALGRQARALDIDLRIETDASVPPAVVVDPEKIGWAVSSLVGNALRHVKHGTRQMPGGSIGVDAKWDGGKREIVIVVVDDGPGIPAQIMERLFHRAPDAPHALGLALTVVRDIVNAHGGTMDITTSTDDETHGTTVTLRIPQP